MVMPAVASVASGAAPAAGSIANERYMWPGKPDKSLAVLRLFQQEKKAI